MNLQQITASLLLTAISLFTPFPKIVAQNPPANTYNPGFWQPIARFSPATPVEVKLINQTSVTLNYDVTGKETLETQEILPGETGSVKEFFLPAYILIYPDNSIPAIQRSQLKLKYEVTVDTNNVVTAKIVNANNLNIPEFQGNRTLNLHETGAIYIY